MMKSGQQPTTSLSSSSTTTASAASSSSGAAVAVAVAEWQHGQLAACGFFFLFSAACCCIVKRHLYASGFVLLVSRKCGMGGTSFSQGGKGCMETRQGMPWSGIEVYGEKRQRKSELDNWKVVFGGSMMRCCCCCRCCCRRRAPQWDKEVFYSFRVWRISFFFVRCNFFACRWCVFFRIFHVGHVCGQ